MVKEAIHFGAGNIGRGFIGPLLMDSDYKVVFVDIVQAVIDRLNDSNLPHYTVNVLSKAGVKQEKYTNDKYMGITPMDDALNDHFVTAEMATTSVGPAVLPKVAMSLFSGLKRRMQKNPDAVFNVIACENLIGGSDCLKEHTFNLFDNEKFTAGIDKDAFRKYLEEKVGFANCAVDRIVPPFTPSEDPMEALDVTVEEFCEWDVEAASLKKDPEVKGLIKCGDLSAYVERKLFTVNTAHCTLAYLGHLKGYKTIDESISDEEIYQTARNAIEESGAALVLRHNKDFTKESHQKYIDLIIDGRMQNDKLVDEVERVGRCPKRKLANNDRLVGPAMLCAEYNLPYENLAKGAAAALLFNFRSDEESTEVQKLVNDKGVQDAFIELSGLSMDDHVARPFIELVVQEYERLK